MYDVFTPNPAKDLRDADRPWRNFCTQLQIFFYRGESERACYDTPLIRRFCSAAFPVRNGRRYFIYEKSRVLSFSHTILLPDHGFPCVSLRHCSPSTVSKYQQGSCSDIFLSKFPDRSTRMHRFLGMETCKRFNVSFFRNIVYLS